MSRILEITKKDLISFFKSPLSYCVLAVFFFLTGWSFYNLMISYVDNIQNLPEVLGGQLTFLEVVVLKSQSSLNFFLVFFIPLLCMKSFSSEMKSGTLDLLYLSKMKEWEIVIGKFIAYTLMAISLLSILILFGYIYYSAKMFDLSIVFFGVLALILNCGLFVSISLFCSTLTTNMIVSAILSLAMILGLSVLSWSLNNVYNETLFSLVQFLSLNFHFEALMKAHFQISSVFYYLSLTSFFLYLSKKSLESRNW